MSYKLIRQTPTDDMRLNRTRNGYAPAHGVYLTNDHGSLLIESVNARGWHGAARIVIAKDKIAEFAAFLADMAEG